MVLNKNDKISDAVTDLYRASFYIALQSKETGLSFLKKAKEKFGDKLDLDIEKIREESGNNYLYWAEKILDEHKRLKISLFSSKTSR